MRRRRKRGRGRRRRKATRRGRRSLLLLLLHLHFLLLFSLLPPCPPPSRETVSANDVPRQGCAETVSANGFSR
eukprot:8761722-Pyramimonas_sp.AAC.1